MEEPRENLAERNVTREVWLGSTVWVLFFFCCLVRLIDLGWKAIMHDEALFVYYTEFQLYREWNYFYLPILHGPAMLHLQALVFHLFGSSDYTMRLGCALLGIAGFYWIWRLKPWLGKAGVLVALAFYTFSPGIVYYQRFFRNDALYMFNSLWIVTSLALWWHHRKPAWLASALIGCTVLFSNKESSLFVYFSIFTFFLLLVIHDLSAWLFKGKKWESLEPVTPGIKFPNPIWPTLLIGGFIVLCITMIFEGLEYDDDVVQAIGHDWVLKDVRSIPLALGWVPGTGPGVESAGFWRLFYTGLFAGLLLVFSAAKLIVSERIGETEFVSSAWSRIAAARWHVLAALALCVFIYLWVFTTGFKHKWGFFEIYEKTWSYWGGQHEWGRIGGPFHQHMLNMLVYELPAVLIVGCVWIGGLFRFRSSRILAISFFLMLFAVAAFHKLLFSGLEYRILPDSPLVELHVPYLKQILYMGFFVGLAILLVPVSARTLVPVSFFSLIVYSIAYLRSADWRGVFFKQLYRDGDPVRLSNRHVDMRSYMEIQFNFDGGTSLAIVLALIFFATFWAWVEIGRGRRFRAFLIWWTVTATGAASYAREAVPQVGIHAMLPLILLASSYANEFLLRSRGYTRYLAAGFIGIAVLWNAKSTINLNFYHADDVRERMVYGPIPQDLKNHCDFVMKYHAIAPVRVDGNGVPYWHTANNDRTRVKQVRVGVTHDPVVWAVRWYLRDVEWRESKNVNEFVDQDYEFLFVTENEANTNENLKKKYQRFRGSAIRFWQPRKLDEKRMVDIWKEYIPGHYLDASPQAGEAYNAKQEWWKIWRYMLLRETFDGGAEGSGNVSGTQYVFCVRKDLY